MLHLRATGLLGLLLLGGCEQAYRTGATTGAATPFRQDLAELRRTEGSFRVATFNAEFLFDGIGDEGGTDFSRKGDSTAARVHRQAVAAVVRALDADVVVLVETENIEVLRAMVDHDLPEMGYTPYLIEGRDTFTRQDVGVLSRVAVDTTFRTDERAPVAGGGDSYGVSKNLIVRFVMHGRPISLIGLHLLAQPENVGRRARREAQAETIRRAVAREIAAGREVIVTGDFNDYDDTVPDARGARPITLVLETIRSAGAGAHDDLVNVLTDVPRASRYTVGRDYDGDGLIEPHETSLVDHVLLSPALYRLVEDVRVAHLPEARAASDHWPVVVTLGAD